MLLTRMLILLMLSLNAHGDEIHIGPGRADRTVNEWSRQTGLQVLFEFKTLRHSSTHGVSGELDNLQALRAMLEGTGLVFDRINANTIAVIPQPARPVRVVLGRIDANTAWFETGRFVWCNRERYTVTLGDYWQFAYGLKEWCELNDTTERADLGIPANMAAGDATAQTGNPDLQSVQDESGQSYR